MTYISSSYAQQDAAFSTEFDEASDQLQPTGETKRSFFAWFHPQNWEPLCPDLLTEISIGLGRQD